METTPTALPKFVSMLPCGMVTPFNQALTKFLSQRPELAQELSVDLEGNVNHETSYYPKLELAENPEDLPDILVGSDINNLFHKRFRERFIDKGVFAEYLPYGRNALLDSHAFFDPDRRFTMLSANMLVLVADLERLGSRPVPKSWADLLSSQYENSVAIRGDGSFFCNGVLLPFFKAWKEKGVEQLAKNICAGLHPSQMAKMAGAGQPDTPALFIMPYFFFDKVVHKENVRLIWPEEGAIASPVFILVKPEAAQSRQALLDFLVSKEMGEVFCRRGFPHCHPDTQAELPSQRYFWIGWDYLKNSDVGKDKDVIQEIFQRDHQK
ncbi:MAG TPA: ABC transporter substrate-binding protein [Fibrobacteraceae bacterium]|nr:ABC transporter substrate-binding protein [Fibrobacteraceae bacterium]